MTQQEQKIVDSMVDQMEPPREDLPPEAEEAPVDSEGYTFDPELHVVDEQGNPKLTATGKLKRKRGKGSRPKSTIGGVEPGPGPEMPIGIMPAETYQQTGKATAELIFVMGQALGGKEWKPTEDEREYMAYAWARYLESKGIQDLPPGVVLATAMLCYAGPRLSKPQTQSKLSRAYRWIKRKWRAARGIREPEEPEAASDAT